MKEHDIAFDNECVTTILTHYRKYGRHDLVWRKNITAYKILVSEIMLQQTQVKRVEEKFKEWMKVYPTLKRLRHSSLKDILIIWQGLGYQRRAKALHQIGASYTAIPRTYEELLLLPGVGSYTASAVCAFAYDMFAYPVLETNIRTALIEFFHEGESEIHDGLLLDDLSRLEKNSKVRKIGARVWYYALMDFGAYLKLQKISHNTKSKHYTKQSPYKGSRRELRAKILFAIAHGKILPSDERKEKVIEKLVQEEYIIKLSSKKYSIRDFKK
jgi:A/G-specific adenine glycosylase